MLTKDDVMTYYGPEVKLTAKVLRAVPEDQLQFKAHEKSSSVQKLIKTFIVEMVMNMSFLKGDEPKDSMDEVQDFTTIEEGVMEFEAKAKEFMDALAATSDEDLKQPLTMWGMTMPRTNFMFMMMLDMVHHRGQLSVYIRLAGGLVPSIYGPSADDDGGMKA